MVHIEILLCNLWRDLILKFQMFLSSPPAGSMDNTVMNSMENVSFLIFDCPALKNKYKIKWSKVRSFEIFWM